MTRLCINCRRRPEGPELIGITSTGKAFVSRPCERCLRHVNEAMFSLIQQRWGQAALLRFFEMQVRAT